MDSCCTCFHAASSASATSASSPTGNEPWRCRSASTCLRVHQTCQPTLLSNQPGQPFFPSAHTAAQPCRSSNDSHQTDCLLAPHRNSIGAPHDPGTPASNPSHATACPPSLRPKPLSLSCQQRQHASHTTRRSSYNSDPPSSQAPGSFTNPSDQTIRPTEPIQLP